MENESDIKELDMKELGTRIVARRKALGLTQKELGFLLNVDKQVIYNLEKGKNKKIDLDLLMGLAARLRCTQDYLCGLSNKPGRTQNSMKNVFIKYPERMSGCDSLETDPQLMELSPKLIYLINKCKLELDKDGFELVCMMIELVLTKTRYEKMITEQKQQTKSPKTSV